MSETVFQAPPKEQNGQLEMEQLNRANRYLERIRKIYAGVEAPYHSLNGFEDDTVSFFIHCHHIGDWIYQLHKANVSKSDVNRFIDQHDELKICADFCNGSKHCQLDRKKFTNSQPHMAGKSYWSLSVASLSEKKPSLQKAAFTISSNGKIYDALILAERCMQLWNNYIKSLSIN